MGVQASSDSRNSQLFYLMAESAPEAMLTIEDGVIRYANPASCRLFGVGAPKLLSGLHVGQFLESEILTRLPAGLQVEPFPGILRRRNGAPLDVQVRCRPLSASGTLFAVYVSNRTNFGEALSTLSQVIESAPNGVVMMDASGRIGLVNSKLERMFGYSRADLLNQPIESLLPERFRSGQAAMRAEYLKQPRPRATADRELLGLRADGSEFPIEIGLNTLETPQGTMILAAILDISARKQLEMTFQKIVEAAPYGMVMVDTRGKIVFCNALIESMFGYSRTELLDQPLEMLLPERYKSAHVKHRGGYGAAPGRREMGAGRDLMALHKDGTEFPVEIGLNPVPSQEGMMTLAAVVDITKRKAMELELRQANANLEEFTYVASHDLKSPIRGIADLIEWISEDLGDQKTPEVQRNLERVSIRVKRMERIIEDLLAYARAGRTTTDLVMVELPTLIQGILDVQPVPSGFQVIVKVTAVPFKAAKTPLETVLRNLIGNAVKHHDRAEGTIEVTVEEDDTYCVFSVSDDGPGIPAKAQDRIFRMFQTLSASQREGSGIGLALTKRLVESHGGRITLQSEEGTRKTTFRFWWPRFERRGSNE